MKYFVILIIFFITVSINESYAEMSYSEFQDFCKETKNTNLDLMPIDQRLLAHLCGYLDSGLSEKYWNWIGADLNWKNFAQNVSNEYAQEIPLFVEKGLEDSLVVNTSISGRDSFPPPMSVYISFYYDEDNKTKRFGEKYMVKISGEFTKAKDHRLPPLKLFNIGYHLDEIQCKENLVLLQKYDDSPACVKSETVPKLVAREWGTSDNWIKISNTNKAIHYDLEGGIVTDVEAFSEHKNPSLPEENMQTWLQIKLRSTQHGHMQITLPRTLIDAKIGNMDDDFFILLDGTETKYQETKTEHERILEFYFTSQTDIIEIIGYGFYNSELNQVSSNSQSELLDQLRKTSRIESMQNFTDAARDFVVSEALYNQEVSNLLSGHEYEVRCCAFSLDRNDIPYNRYVGLTFDVPEKYMKVVVTYDLTKQQISGVGTEILLEDGIIKVGEK